MSESDSDSSQESQSCSDTSHQSNSSSNSKSAAVKLIAPETPRMEAKKQVTTDEKNFVAMIMQ